MTASRYLLSILLVSLLAACGPGDKDEAVPQKDSEPAVVQREAKPETPPAKPQQAPVQPAPEAEPVKEPTPAPSKPAAKPKTEKSPEKVAQIPPRTKLDLSLPAELAAQLDAEDRAVEAGLEPLLPAFFEEKKPSLNPFQVSGKLLTGQNGEDYWDSVEGAELHFEFRR